MPASPLVRYPRVFNGLCPFEELGLGGVWCALAELRKGYTRLGLGGILSPLHVSNYIDIVDGLRCSAGETGKGVAQLGFYDSFYLPSIVGW